MDDFIQKVKAFIERIKDDPNLSDMFRDAANELHEQLNPPPQDAPAEPVADEPSAQPEG